MNTLLVFEQLAPDFLLHVPLNFCSFLESHSLTTSMQRLHLAFPQWCYFNTCPHIRSTDSLSGFSVMLLLFSLVVPQQKKGRDVKN